MKNGKMLKWLINIMKPLLIVMAIAVLLYWFNFRPLDVTGYKVVQGTVTNTVMGTGTLEAKTNTIISSKIAGRIEKITVDQGDRVKRGELLVQLDDDELTMQTKVAEANLEVAKSTVSKLKYDLNYTKAVLENADKVHQRQLKLIAKNIVSQEELDKAIENLRIAKANFNRSKSAIIEAEKEIIEAQRNLDLRHAQLKYTKIYAPFDGVIVFRARDPGDIVVPGTPVLSLVSTKVLWIESWVGETKLENIRIGQPAKVVFRSSPGKSISGRVERLAKEVDKETREFIVDVIVDKLPVNWAIGQRAEVYIDTARKENIIAIPENFIKWTNGKSGVFLYDNGRARWATVTQGLRGNGMIEITDGIREGDLIINSRDPKKQLYDNCKVSLK